jgi:hypothetical protein
VSTPVVLPGAWGAARAIRDLLERHVTEALRSVESDDPDLQRGELEDPALIVTSEPDDLGVDQTPALVISVAQSDSVAVDDVDLLTESWEIAYAVTVEAYVAGHDIESADRWRYSYVLALRRALLSHRGWGALTIRPSFREAYDEVGQLDRGGWFSSGLIRFTVTVAEDIETAEALGTVAVVDVDSYSVAADAPFPDHDDDEAPTEVPATIGPR